MWVYKENNNYDYNKTHLVTLWLFVQCPMQCIINLSVLGLSNEIMKYILIVNSGREKRTGHCMSIRSHTRPSVDKYRTVRWKWAMLQ